MSMEILTIITTVVSLILGVIAKRSKWVKNEMIPLQNLIVGVAFAIVEWIITKDFDAAIAVSGLLAGGVYDIFHNISKLVKN